MTRNFCNALRQHACKMGPGIYEDRELSRTGNTDTDTNLYNDSRPDSNNIRKGVAIVCVWLQTVNRNEEICRTGN